MLIVLQQHTFTLYVVGLAPQFFRRTGSLASLLSGLLCQAQPTLAVARAKRGYKSIRIQNIRDKNVH